MEFEDKDAARAFVLMVQDTIAEIKLRFRQHRACIHCGKPTPQIAEDCMHCGQEDLDFASRPLIETDQEPLL